MNSFSNSSDQVIIALDGMNKAEALSFVSKLPDLSWVKIGLELFVSEGPQIISALRALGLKVFLDLKFHDIPNTVARSCFQAAKTGADLISVHACSGVRALLEAKEAAIEGAQQEGLKPPSLLAITVLTSWNQQTINQELLISQPIELRVKWLAKIASEAGISGCVCSPLEVKELKAIYPENFQLVTPGIRLANEQKGDQERVMSPREAIDQGASRIVIGRPVTKASDPNAMFLKICSQLV